MFEVQVNNDTYRVFYRHINSSREKSNPDTPLDFTIPQKDPSRSTRKVKRDGTICQIMRLNQKESSKSDENVWDFQFDAFAALSPKDARVLEVGRKISLTKALRLSGFDRDTRTEFWKAYFASRGIQHDNQKNQETQ